MVNRLKHLKVCNHAKWKGQARRWDLDLMRTILVRDRVEIITSIPLSEGVEENKVLGHRTEIEYSR